MKRSIVIAIAILTVGTAVVFLVFPARAQEPPAGDTTPLSTDEGQPDPDTERRAAEEAGTLDFYRQAPTSPQEQGRKENSCLETSALGFPVDFNLAACFARLGYYLMWIFSLVLWLSGQVLDIAVHYSLRMGDLLKKVAFVDIGWVIFRDLGNILFIFALLWIAITTILGLASGNTKRLLLNVIIAALLINFSLFVTKAVVDASNLVALHFYSLINPNPNNPFKNSLSANIMEGLKLQTLYNAKSVGSGPGDLVLSNISVGISNNQTILVTVIGSIFILVAAFVFFAAAILFLIRAVVLMVLMATSPLAFIGSLLPGPFKAAAGKWWQTLWSQAFFAPVFLVLAYAVVQTIRSDGFKSVVTVGSAELNFVTALTSGISASVGVIVNFIILIGLLVSCLIVSKSLGAFGAGAMLTLGKKLRDAGQGFVGRNLLGRPARLIEEKLGETKFGQSLVGAKLRELTLQPLTKAKFGGKVSAEEAYEEGRLRRERREEIETQEFIQKEITAAKQFIDPRERSARVQRAIGRLTPKGFTNLPKEVLMYDEDVIRNAPTAHIEAVLASKRLSEAEQNKMLSTRWQPLDEGRKKYSKEMESYHTALDLWQKETDEGRLPPRPQPAKPRLEQGAMDLLRGATQGDLAQLHRVFPQLFSDRELGPIFRFRHVEEFRASPLYANAEKENLRDMKFSPLVDAADMAHGIDPHDPAFKQLQFEVKRRLRAAAEKKVKKITEEAAKAGKSSGAAMAEAVKKGEFLAHDIELEVAPGVSEKRSYRVAADTPRQEFLMRHAEERMIEGLGESSPPEIARTPGRIWKRSAVMRQLGSSVLNTPQFRDKDVVEHQLVFETILKQWDLDRKAVSSMSAANREALQWLLKVKEGRRFFTNYNALSEETRNIHRDAKRAFGAEETMEGGPAEESGKTIIPPGTRRPPRR